MVSIRQAVQPPFHVEESLTPVRHQTEAAVTASEINMVPLSRSSLTRAPQWERSMRQSSGTDREPLWPTDPMWYGLWAWKTWLDKTSAHQFLETPTGSVLEDVW